MDCQLECQRDATCRFFNWNSKSGLCFLRSNLAKVKESLNENASVAFVGAKYCTDYELIWPEIYPPSPRFGPGSRDEGTMPSSDFESHESEDNGKSLEMSSNASHGYDTS